MRKVLATSALVSVAIVALACLVSAMVPRDSIVFTGLMVVSLMVGSALVQIIPEALRGLLAPQSSGALVVALALGAWFLIAWAICMPIVWRLRSSAKGADRNSPRLSG